MQSLAKISQQTLWQIVGKVVTSLSTFVILSLVTRNYGEQGTGTFTLALTYLAIFYLLSDFGLNAHQLKKFQLSNVKFQNEQYKKLLGTRIVWSTVLVILATSLLPFLPFAGKAFSMAVTFGSLAIVGSAIFTTCNLIFQSKLRYDLSVLASSIGTILSLGLFIFLITSKFSVATLLLAHLFGWISISVVALILTRRLLHSVSPIFDKQYSINLFKESWPIAATLALNVVYFRSDSFMISYFRSTAEVGIYNVAYSVFQSALVLPTFIMNAYYPMMLKSLDGIKRVGLILLSIASIGTLFTFFLAPFITGILTGGGFSGSSQSLQILSLGFPAYFPSSLLMWLLVSKGRYKRLLLVYGLGLVLNLILNFYFIPTLSFYAASWTTVISEYFILVMQFLVIY